MNSNVFEGNDPRNLVLPREGNTFHADHGNEKAAEIIAVLVNFLSYSDSSRINMNSYLNNSEFFSRSGGASDQAFRVLLDDGVVVSNLRCTCTHYLLEIRIQHHCKSKACTH